MHKEKILVCKNNLKWDVHKDNFIDISRRWRRDFIKLTWKKSHNSTVIDVVWHMQIKISMHFMVIN